jgi:hypothetical protein
MEFTLRLPPSPAAVVGEPRYERVPGAVCFGRLVDVYGGLLERQPCFAFLAREVLRAVCDLEAMTTCDVMAVGVSSFSGDPSSVACMRPGRAAPSRCWHPAGGMWIRQAHAPSHCRRPARGWGGGSCVVALPAPRACPTTAHNMFRSPACPPFQPLDLDNVFVDASTLRVYLGRVKWGRSVEAFSRCLPWRVSWSRTPLPPPPRRPSTPPTPANVWTPLPLPLPLPVSHVPSFVLPVPYPCLQRRRDAAGTQSPSAELQLRRPAVRPARERRARRPRRHARCGAGAPGHETPVPCAARRRVPGSACGRGRRVRGGWGWGWGWGGGLCRGCVVVHWGDKCGRPALAYPAHPRSL